MHLVLLDLVADLPDARAIGGLTMGADPIAAVEKFYAQSEQRPARVFQLGEEDYALVSEHPDCDAAWFRALTPEAVRTLDQTETLALMERRIYRWHCGCNQQRMMEVLAPAMKQRLEGLTAHHSIAYSRQLLGFEFSDSELDMLKGAVHPLVRVNPRTGRRSLYMASHANRVIEMPLPEGRLLITELTLHATQRHQATHRLHPSTAQTSAWDQTLAAKVVAAPVAVQMGEYQ